MPGDSRRNRGAEERFGRPFEVCAQRRIVAEQHDHEDDANDHDRRGRDSHGPREAHRALAGGIKKDRLGPHFEGFQDLNFRLGVGQIE